MTLPDFLTRIAPNEIFLTGHRIGLHHVVHFYNEGYSPEMLVGQFPTLPLSLVHKVIAFYLENRADLDAHFAEVEKILSRQRDEGKHIDLHSLRQRLQQLQQAESRPA